MRVLLIIIFAVLAGCASQATSHRTAFDQAQADCVRDTFPIVRPYVATWPRAKAQAYFRYVVRECVAQELAYAAQPVPALPLAGTMLQGYSAGFQGQVPLFMGVPSMPFGAPNSIGPYGTLGPTWQSFNGFFQPQMTPQQHMQQMLVQ